MASDHRQRPEALSHTARALTTTSGAARRRKIRLQRKKLHYDWHWQWDCGNGDMGNQGVHEMDMARWGLGVGLPTRITGTGGHYMFDDDQQTPNTLICTFDYPEQKQDAAVRNPPLGYKLRRRIWRQRRATTWGCCSYGSEGYMETGILHLSNLSGTEARAWANRQRQCRSLGDFRCSDP